MTWTVNALFPLFLVGKVEASAVIDFLGIPG